jgi:hypothetical protein
MIVAVAPKSKGRCSIRPTPLAATASKAATDSGAIQRSAIAHETSHDTLRT